MNIPAILQTGLTSAMSAAVAKFTSNLTVISSLPQSSTNGQKLPPKARLQNVPLMYLVAIRCVATWYASGTESSD